MTTEGVNLTEDAEMAECDGDKVVTMMDVLQEQQDFEEDANAVLGASDDKNCTYAKGYIKRQAIYACLTCCPDVKTDPTKRAGVCLACSLNCHENHELVELYTKRNFRCDCGNPMLNSNPCQYTPNKTDLNNDNIYNQNFSGLYCICERPYPDLEANFEDDMIQCIVCEDWLHASHLDAVVPANDQYSEMICKGCMEKNEFLHDYSALAVNVETVDIVTVNGNHSLNSSLFNGDVVNAEGEDIEMAVDKEKKAKINEGITKPSESIASQEKTKPTEEQETKQTEVILDNNAQIDNTDNKDGLNTDIKTHEPDSIKTIETDNEDNDSPVKEVQKETDITPKAIDNESTIDDKIESVNETSEAAKEQIKQDELAINVVNTDSDKSVRINTEDQFLTNNRVSTSGNPSEELKSSNGKPADSLEKVEHSITSDNNITKIDPSPSEQTNVKSDPSQEFLVKESMDDKSDAVMDAIDALLESNTEVNNCDPKKTDDDSRIKEIEEKEETQKGNDVDVCAKEIKQNEFKNKENSTIDSPEKTGADGEMTDSIRQNNSLENEYEVSNKINHEKKKEADTTEITNTENNSESIITMDSSETSVATGTDKLLNGDISNEALNENKMVNYDKSKNDDSKTTESSKENKRKLSITDDLSPKKVKLNISMCVRPKGIKKVHKGATFWPSHFRQRLCTCGECIAMYKDLNVLFLTDLEDTVSYYENLGKENVDGGASQYEKGLQALSSLDRIQQINALTEYNKMRDKLLDFLKSFKDRKEIVKEEDIKAFFAGMKPRREPDGVYFCR